ncbi:MAG: prepilin-type N-terminal cleavage/methylation domain-containing protein [Deltaproteobacteria bacterium]|nr:prepilin-type N-terminal cleavage/methylation domain-containing protein [Deltaproteobacteria bacterium]
MKSKATNHAGFSLLEVLVATTLMGLVLVVLIQILTTVLRAQETTRAHVQALMVAEKVLQEQCDIRKLEEANYQGQDGRYGYRVRVTPQYETKVPNTNKQIKCFLIQVTVSWRERGRDKSVDLQTARIAALKS